MPEKNIIRAAIYCRVSTDDQAERGTIEAQIHALRQTVPHWGMEIVGEYLDDGYSGTLPLEKRPEGLRLMDDAKAGKIDVVAFLKTDRLARSLRHLLDIIDYFDGCNVALRCVQEPFDTSNAVGRMIVAMMASFAEVERETILSRTAMGRERIARDGRWTGGALPYGYRVDNDGHLTAETEPRNGYDFNEAMMVERIFRMVADGKESAKTVARTLNTEGIPCWRKHQRRGAAEPDYRTSNTGLWWPNHIAKMIRSTTYKGEHTFNKSITREVPALVDTETWERANRQLTANIKLSARSNDHQYLLRGLIRCAGCGAIYSGQRVTSNKGGKPQVLFYYRCGAQSDDRRIVSERCKGKAIRAEWIEDLVWQDIKKFVMDPGEVLEQLQERMNMELEAIPSTEERRQEIERILAQKEIERDRVLDAYRRSLIDIEELEDHINRSKAEAEPLHGELMELIANEANTGIIVGDLANTEDLLRTLRETIEQDLDWETRRSVVEGLVTGLTVETTGTGHKKKANVSVSYNFSEPNCVVSIGAARRRSRPGCGWSWPAGGRSRPRATTP